MAVVEAQRSRMRKIGNSMGVIVPAEVRRAGEFESGDAVSVQSPRPGVITISRVENEVEEKAQTWGELQELVSRRALPDAFWPKGKSFKEVLHEARDEAYEARDEAFPS